MQIATPQTARVGQRLPQGRISQRSAKLALIGPLALFGVLLADTPAGAEVFRVTDTGSLVAEVPLAGPPSPKLPAQPAGQWLAGRNGVAGAEQAGQEIVPQPPADMGVHFAAAADRYGISQSLLRAIAWTESRYRTNVTSPAGASGVMQLMPATARGLGVTDRRDAAQNVMGGARYLRILLDQFDNDLQLALAGYNAGPSAVRRFRGIPPYRETKAYVKTIIARLANEAAVESR